MTPAPEAVVHLGVVPSSSSTHTPLGGVTTENGDATTGTNSCERLLTTKEVSAIVRLSCSTLSRLRQRGEGPPCLWITPSSPRYRQSDISRWMDGI